MYMFSDNDNIKITHTDNKHKFSFYVDVFDIMQKETFGLIDVCVTIIGGSRHIIPFDNKIGMFNVIKNGRTVFMTDQIRSLSHGTILDYVEMSLKLPKHTINDFETNRITSNEEKCTSYVFDKELCNTYVTIDNNISYRNIITLHINNV